MEDDIIKGFYKNSPNDIIWWASTPGYVGFWLFSFDKEKVYNMFKDYPHNLSKEEVAIFDKENPFWADFFASRKSTL